MQARRFTQEQVEGILREYDGGSRVPDICRRHRVSERTLYLWIRKQRPATAVKADGRGGRRARSLP